MSGYLMGLVFRHGPTSQSERMMLLALAEHAWDDGSHCFPSVQRLADWCCVKERRAQQLLKALEDSGWLTRDAAGGRWKTSTYFVNVARLRAADAQVQDVAPPTERVQSPTERVQSPTERVQSGTERVQPVAPEPSVEPSVEPSYNQTLLQPVGDGCGTQVVLVGEIVADAPQTCSGTGVSLSTGQALEVRQAPAPAPAKGTPLDGFDEWWALYPTKVAKASARKAWAGAVAKAGGADILVAALQQQLPSLRERKARGYALHPTTWLNAERWTDEVQQKGGAFEQLIRDDIAGIRPSGTAALMQQVIGMYSEGGDKEVAV